MTEKIFTTGATDCEPTDCCHVLKKCVKDKAVCLAYGCQIYSENELSAAYGRIRELETRVSETRRSESGESFIGENDYREALLHFTGLRTDARGFVHDFSLACGIADALLDGKAPRSATAAHPIADGDLAEQRDIAEKVQLQSQGATSQSDKDSGLIERLRALEKIALIDKPLIREAIEAISARSSVATNEGETPMTDAVLKKCGPCSETYQFQQVVAIARQLERELADVRETFKASLKGDASTIAAKDRRIAVLETSLSARRENVLEEAAKVCDEYKCDHPGGMIVAGQLASLIRLLKRDE